MSQIELRCCLLIEEYRIVIKDIKGITSTIANALSCFNFAAAKSNNASTIKYVFSMIDADAYLFPLGMSCMSAEQDIDDKLKKRML